MKHSDIAHYRQLNSLRRRFMSRLRRFPPTLEPAAMMDVVLLVLLFFIISSSYVSRPGVEIDLPEVEASTGLPMHALVVTLTRNGLWFFNDQRIQPEKFRQALRAAHRDRPESPLVIETDGEVPVTEQMRAYRDGVAVGIDRIALATRGVREEIR